MSILYISTFSQKLYDFCGRQMLESFLRTQSGDILIAHNNVDLITDPRIIPINLDGSTFYQNILNTNEDIIDISLGGSCEKDLDVDILPIWGSRFNFRWPHFFCKIAAIYEALLLKQYTKFIFIDADCEFKKTIPTVYLNNFAKYRFVYLLGEARKNTGNSIETGFLYFDVYSNTVYDTINCFATGDFRKFDRMDDGYIFRKMLDKNIRRGELTLDLAQNHMAATKDILPYTPLSSYLIHKKGTVKKELGIS